MWQPVKTCRMLLWKNFGKWPKKKLCGNVENLIYFLNLPWLSICKYYIGASLTNTSIITVLS